MSKGKATDKFSGLTVERVRELFSYDADTGLLTRRIRTSNRVHVGDVVGTAHRFGYLFVGIGARLYKVHRIIWLHVTGEWPKEDLDHINGVRDDNRFSNLREASRSENMQNQRKARGNNRTGVLGVYLYKQTGRFAAAIGLPGRGGHTGRGEHKHLGYFKTKEEAQAAYLSAKRIYHPRSTL